MIEINLKKLERGTHEGTVMVHRDGKVFQRKQKLGRKEKSDDLFKDIKNYNNASDFIRKNIKELKKYGIESYDKAEEFYNKIRMERFTPKEITREEAEEAIYDGVPGNILSGWYRSADSNYKIKLYDKLLNNDNARNGTYKLMHHTYNTQNNTNIPFNEFMNMDVKLYRGGGINEVDIFTSFTMSKKIADKFMKESNTNKFTEITVKPIEILGMCQPTGEAEVLVPKDVLGDKLNKSENINSELLFDKYLAALRYPNDKKGD